MKKAVFLLFILGIDVLAQSGTRRILMQQQRQERRQEREQQRQERLLMMERRPLVGDKLLAETIGPLFGNSIIEARLWAHVLRIQPEQLLRIQALRSEIADQYLHLEANIREKRSALDRAIYADKLDEELIKQLAEELARLEGERVLIRTRIHSKIRQILTPEQIRIVRELRYGLSPEPHFPPEGRPHQPPLPDQRRPPE
ncbi:MAG: Spy/CpxP family protein refolding chaperone [Acidobacteriota bacterium]|nr:Spy/CpxP family protein refolding chaperone [Blastocatellia bacterium]MDW8411799.1 Spy/CpxP family protein refolding chaperone [Acidobacteriota bacterium]